MTEMRSTPLIDKNRSRSSARAIRVGFVSCGDPADPDLISGMPHACCTALAATGLDVVPLIATKSVGKGVAPSLSSATRPLRGSLSFPRPSLQLGLGLRSRVRGFMETMGGWREYERTLECALSQSRSITRQIVRERIDVLVGVCVSTSLSDLVTDIPILYASDATARLINTTYPTFARRSRGYKLACDRIERAALSRLKCGFYASPFALESAMRDYGVPPERARLLPLGANIRPHPDERIDPDPPTRENLRILVVASDPRRKRLDLCVEIIEKLRARGWTVEMIHIGRPTRRALRSPLVRCLGPLKLSNANDRVRHRDALRQSHFCLLPSTGEMFGIAPCESAHFGRPSVVSDAGGLPFVVEHGRTGLVIPLKATAEEYALAIERISSDEQTYLRMGRRALERARTEFTWEAWARGVLEAIREVTADQQSSFREISSTMGGTIPAFAWSDQSVNGAFESSTGSAP